jgi:hypothetical protein
MMSTGVRINGAHQRIADRRSMMASRFCARSGQPPGAYVFGVDITQGRYQRPSGPPTFLPGTGDAKDATVFELEPGDNRDLGSIRIRRPAP